MNRLYFNRPCLKIVALICLIGGSQTPFIAAADYPGTPSSQATAPAGRIAYVAASGYGPARRFQLMTADPDGSNPQIFVSSTEPLMAPAWSPDGKRLAYVAYKSGNSAIFVGDLQANSQRSLVQERGMHGAPAWSPDGRSLAVSLSFRGNADIYVVDVATGNLRQLTNNPGIDTEPSWSPKGDEIVFTSDRSGGPHIFRVNANGGSGERMTFTGRQNMRASYAPDGQSLVLVSQSSGRFRIGVLDVATKSMKLVSNGPLDESPSFTADGKNIVYTSREGAELVMVSAAGQPVKRQRQRIEIHDVACSRYSSSTSPGGLTDVALEGAGNGDDAGEAQWFAPEQSDVAVSGSGRSSWTVNQP